METLVLPSQDQLSQHQYWQKRNVMDIFSPRKSDLSSPMYRSIHRTSSAADFVSPPASFSQSLFSSVARPSSAGGRPHNQNQPPKGRASPVKNGRGHSKPASKGSGSSNSNKGARNAKGGENAAPIKPKSSKMGFVKKERGGSRKESPSPPKITILQRPQTKEAALLDLAKITGLPLSEVYAKNGMAVPEYTTPPAKDSKAEGRVEKTKAHKPQQRKGEVIEKAKPDSVPVKQQEGSVAKVLKKEEDGVAKVLKQQEDGVAKVLKQQEDGVAKVLEQQEDGVAKVLKHQEDGVAKVLKQQENGVAKSKLESLFDEKWAGPAFANSPPPSSLPIPNFSLRKREIVATQVQFARIMDTEAATRGLRRLLNLDF